MSTSAPILEVESVRRALRDRWWKRPFDLILGVPLTAVSLPVILVLALIVRLDSPGSGFFRQERIGKDGVPFRMWKLRSMRSGVSDSAHRDAAEAWFTKEAEVYKSLGDSRITKFGRFLRKSNLDELPQLFNVLAGEMSLVGPRPSIAYELEFFRARDFERQRVRPGMTGPWQISDREHMPASEMMALDLRYVATATPARDLAIIWGTVLLVLRTVFARVAR
jgi:lipopolysaccharide/colanic/teichoic acid biosynthesis glycosyltransferase